MNSSNPPISPSIGIEVVKGREVGQTYPVRVVPFVLGRAIGAVGGLDLAKHEPDGPRRMSARHAMLEKAGEDWVVRDLDSELGTFVNRRRILPGQFAKLKSGDLLDLGGVQVRFVAVGPSASNGECPGTTPRTDGTFTSSRPQPATPFTGQFAHPFQLPGGALCRTWDDFLVLSAQRWSEVREELISGRLGKHMILLGRPDLAPKITPHADSDLLLDAWLESLPTTRSGQPELEVHPRSLKIRATSGGRVTRSLQITNIGFRLLRTRATFDPPDVPWLSFPGDLRTIEVQTTDTSELSVHIDLPESAQSSASAAILLESSGGRVRVAVLIEQGTTLIEEPAATSEIVSATIPVFEFKQWLGKYSTPRRLMAGAVIAGGLRLTAGLSQAAAGLPISGDISLPGPALLMAFLGASIGVLAAVRRRSVADLFPFIFTGMLIGVAVSALGIALFQAVEPLLGGWLSSQLWSVTLLWSLLGAGIAGLLSRGSQALDQEIQT